MERDYFDARFDGLKELMVAQDRNMKAYVGAVSSSVREVRDDLQEHKENSEAHGVGAAARQGGSTIQWLALVISVVAAVGVVVPLLRK